MSQLKAGQLVSVWSSAKYSQSVTLGNVDTGFGGFSVPNGTPAIIFDTGHGSKIVVLVDGKLGWLYHDECREFLVR